MGFFGPIGATSTARTLPTVPIASGRVLHLDASVASSLFDATSGGSAVAVGGSVARWEDQSGNGRHATQSTSNNRPVYRKYDDIGGLYFDGSNDNLTGSFTTLSAQTLCVAARINFNSTSNPRFFTQRNTGSQDFNQTGNYIPLIRESTNYTLGVFAGGGQRVQTAIKATDISFMSIHTGSSLFIRFNGTESSTYSHTMNGTFAEYSLCANFGQEWFQALVFEVIVYDSAISSSDRTSIEDYFKDKYRWAW